MLGGCLPGRAVLHTRQLTLFLMICRLPTNPLHEHARYILGSGESSPKSWFQQVSDLCTQYGLSPPIQLLSNPPSKEQFKQEMKFKITKFWHEKLAAEIAQLKSLKYFKPELYSLTKPHYMWTTAAGKPFECSKSTVLGRMASGRYRSEMLKRYWSTNRSGSCRAPSCQDTPGTLEHLLAECPALSQTRERLYQMWLERTVMFPTLHATIRSVLASETHQIVQFVLEPLAFTPIFENFKSHGINFTHQLSFLTRTFAFYMHREYQKVVKNSNIPYIPAQLYHPTHTNISISVSEGLLTHHTRLNTRTGPPEPSSDDSAAQRNQYSLEHHPSCGDWPTPLFRLGMVSDRTHQVSPCDQISTSQPLPGPCLTVLQCRQTCLPSICPPKPASVCLRSVVSPVLRLVQDNCNQLVTSSLVTVTMTMTGTLMTTPPLSLPFSATNLPRDDRAFNGPVVHVSDSTEHSSSNTTPAVPSLTPPTARQQSRYAAPWSGRYKTVTEHYCHDMSSVVNGSVGS